MKYCADTWFLLLLAKGDDKACELMNRVAEGKDELFIPSICIVELTRLLIRIGRAKSKIKKIIEYFSDSENITIENLDEELAYLSGRLSASYNIPTVDSVIAATHIVNKCDFLLSADKHFLKLERDKLLKLMKW